MKRLLDWSNDMRDRRGVASFICALVAVAGIAVAWSSAQTPLTPKLAPDVREYVKFDDAVTALSHIRVIDGTGQPARENRTLGTMKGSLASFLIRIRTDPKPCKLSFATAESS